MTNICVLIIKIAITPCVSLRVNTPTRLKSGAIKKNRHAKLTISVTKKKQLLLTISPTLSVNQS